MARADPNVATPGPFRQYNGAAELHGLAQVMSVANPLRDTAGVLAFNQFHHHDQGGPVDEPLLNFAATSGDLISVPASVYTGRMRLLAQHHYSAAPSKRFPFSSSTSLSHGLLLADNGDPWIIAISTAQGVYARPLKVQGTANPGAPNYSGNFLFRPVLEQLPAFGDASWTQLADASVMAPASGASWAGEGWAYSWAGRDAVLVMRDQPTSYLRTTLWRVSITMTGNAPSSASLAIAEDSVIWAPFTPTRSILKIPAGTTNISFDDLHNGQVTPPASSLVAPVYAYYQTDTLVVARWHFDEGTSSEEIRTEPASPELGWWGTATASTSTACFSTPANGVDGNEALGGDYTSRELGAEYAGMIGLDAGYIKVVRSASELVQKTRTNSSQSTTVHDTLIIPLRDREAMYHYRRIRVADSSDSASITALGYYYDAQTLLSAHGAGNGGNPVIDQGVWEAATGVGNAPSANTIGFHDALSGIAAGVTGGIRVWEQSIDYPYKYISANTTYAPSGVLQSRSEGDGAYIQSLNFEGPIFAGRNGRLTAEQINLVQGSQGPDGSGYSNWSRSFAVDIYSSNVFQYTQPSTVSVEELPLFPHVNVSTLPGIDETPTGRTLSETEDGHWSLIGRAAQYSGSVPAAELDAWNRVPDDVFVQHWLVCQDAATNGRIVYSDAPTPDAGQFDVTLKGSAQYTPAAIASHLVCWVGLP